MPLPFVEQVAKASIEGTASGQPYANVFHVRFGGDFELTNAEATALADEFFDAYVANFGPLMHGDVVMNQCLLADLSSATAGVGIAGTPTEGTDVSGNPLPVQVCQLISWSIARRYRGGHPRTYLPGITASDLTDQTTVSSTRLAALSSAASAFITDVAAFTTKPDCELVVVHYVSGGAIDPTPAVSTVLTGQGRAKLATQRRRLGT